MQNLRFPPAWLWLVDELLPAYVKQHYSPRESWKDKPFSIADAEFFSKGIEELSELFTDERPKKLPAYFAHPKFRSSYLLYFLPLQAAKFVSLFQIHSGAIRAAVKHGRETGVLRVLDLGAGPGTGSLALLLELLQYPLEAGESLPPIEMDWFDTQLPILKDGEALANTLASHFPRLRGKLTIRLHTDPWWKAAQKLTSPTSLILVGHVLNEAPAPVSRASRPQLAPGSEAEKFLREELPTSQAPGRTDHDRDSRDDHGNAGADDEYFGEDEIPDFNEVHPDELTTPAVKGVNRPKFALSSETAALAELATRMSGGGMLIAEPANRRNSQLLSRIRDEFIAHQVVEAHARSIWGPCLHAGKCPLAEGRDWCHFSVPVEIPGRWFKGFSKALGSERQWLKFAYLWLASPDFASQVMPAFVRRVVSDPLSKFGAQESHVLICEPEVPVRLPVQVRQAPHRGDLIENKNGTGWLPFGSQRHGR